MKMSHPAPFGVVGLLNARTKRHPCYVLINRCAMIARALIAFLALPGVLPDWSPL